MLARARRFYTVCVWNEKPVAISENSLYILCDILCVLFSHADKKMHNNMSAFGNAGSCSTNHF